MSFCACKRFTRVAAVLALPWLEGAAQEVIPQPQFMEKGTGSLDLSRASLVVCDSPACRLAGRVLRDEARRHGASLPSSEGRQEPTATVVLLDRSSPSGREAVESSLDTADREILAKHAEQGYVLNVDLGARRILLAGGSAGVLYAAATLVQLWSADSGRLEVPVLKIRDFPDFRYRAAADWLLQGEVNRWGYDWGDGRRNYIERMKRKLDFALRYKINMIFFDGFGWNPERIPGYSRIMRELNRYARERGIKLMFGGYGSYYDPALVRPEHNIGTVYLNRHYYPEGDVYPCIPGDPMPGNKLEADLRTRGTCRANEELLRMKAAELAEFVRSVEPGALYIHFEDQGDFEPTQQAWLYRCGYCRRRWPNDSLKARDGGAGALAHTYKTLYEAIRNVRNLDSGYDASKDCTVVMISPVYRLQEESLEDWNNVLDLWETINSLLPKAEGLEIGFREIFPQAQTGQRWLDAYRQRMAQRGFLPNVFVFLLGGSQGYENSYPFTATAALNGHFRGAETIYNFSGGVHQEPLQMLNGAFAWNARSPGYRDPTTYADSKSTHVSLMSSTDMPAEIFGPSGFLERACRKLYGPAAAPFMARYMLYFETPPAAASQVRMRPHFLGRITPLPTLFDALQQDSKYWDPSIPTDLLRLRDQTIPALELHSHLAALWEAQARVNDKAGSLVQAAVAAGGMAPEAEEDLRYLEKCLEVGRRFSTLLAVYHRGLGTNRTPGQTAGPEMAAKQLGELDAWLNENFRFETVCPLGGDQSSWLEAVRRLRNLVLKK